VPYSPASNGVAERMVGVMMNAVRAMLHDTGLPPRFWAEAAATFMYLRNCTPTKTNDGKTPFEEFYRVKPNVAHIRILGCPVKVSTTSRVGT
jgi:hypothetical protein